MPNTLAHVGLQGLLTRAVMRSTDPKWIYLGAVIPDAPWILQRALLTVLSATDAQALRYYLDVQASLLGCLILCAALALLAARFWRVFAVLALNAVLHLVLDACQTKWANGVHFLAPFSWKMTNWGWFWPESATTYLLAGLGLCYILWHWRRSVWRGPELLWPGAGRLAGLAALLAAYILLPLLLLEGPAKADSHYMRTLSDPQPGQYVEFDRAWYVRTPEGGYLQGPGIRVSGLDLQGTARVSLRGTFITDDEVRVIESHVHRSWLRDGASYLGLLLIAAVWVRSWWLHMARHRRTG